MEQWQKCPVCEGRGCISPIGVSSTAMDICPTCKGQRIINIYTGKAPVDITISEPEITYGLETNND